MSFCKKTKVQPQENPNLGRARIEESRFAKAEKINKKLDNLAKTLSRALVDVELRQLIKAEAGKKFNGQYDIFYKHFAKKNVKNGETVSVKLKKQWANFDTEANEVPKFTISVPVHFDKWNENEFIPLVAVARQDVDEKDLVFVKAYDHEGNEHWLDAHKTPDVPVIVLVMNERTDEEGNVKADYLKNNNKSSKGGRTETNPEYLNRVYSSDPYNLETWMLGDLELRLVVTGATNPTTPQTIFEQAFYISKGAISTVVPNDPCHCNDGQMLDVFLFTWTPAYGNYITHTWIEEDTSYGLTGEISIGVTYNVPPITASLTTKIGIGDMDDHALTATVHKNDPIAQWYGHHSTFSFRVSFPLW